MIDLTEDLVQKIESRSSELATRGKNSTILSHIKLDRSSSSCISNEEIGWERSWKYRKWGWLWEKSNFYWIGWANRFT